MPTNGDDLGYLFPEIRLNEGARADLGRMNPWWRGEAAKPMPPTRRHLVGQIQRRLSSRMAPIIVIRGPRQIGKSTAQMQVIEDLLASGLPPAHILRVQFDELRSLMGLGEAPILRLVDWYERSVLKAKLNRVARDGGRTYLFFDEVQNLREWDVQLKSLVDHTETQVVVTGSSALRIEKGRDSLAGRINTLEVGTLSLSEIASFRSIDLGPPQLVDNGLDTLASKDTWLELRDTGRARARARDAAFARFSERGGYPIVHQRANEPWHLVADQLNETVVRRVIQHDLRLGDRGRKRDPKLLEELFRLVCRYAGQAPPIDVFTRETQRALGGNIGAERVRHYLRFLADKLLVRLVEPLEIRIKRKRGASKLCLADHGLRASWLQEQIPIDPEALIQVPHLTTLAGRLAESILGATLLAIYGLDVAWLPERHGEPEVDFVLTIGARRIPVEVKYQRRIDPLRDTEGLRAFIEKAVNNAPFGVLVTQTDDADVADPRIVSLPLASVMMLR